MKAFLNSKSQTEGYPGKLYDLKFNTTLERVLDAHIAYKLYMITDSVYVMGEKIDKCYFNIYKDNIKIFKKIGYDSS